MTANLVLCILSTVTFCLCVRGLLALVPALARPQRIRIRASFSARARRVGVRYLIFALGVLALASLIGSVQNYIELFG